MSTEQKLISMQIVPHLSLCNVPHPDALVRAASCHQPQLPHILLLLYDGHTRDIPSVT